MTACLSVAGWWSHLTLGSLRQEDFHNMLKLLLAACPFTSQLWLQSHSAYRHMALGPARLFVVLHLAWTAWPVAHCRGPPSSTRRAHTSLPGMVSDMPASLPVASRGSQLSLPLILFLTAWPSAETACSARQRRGPLCTGQSVLTLCGLPSPAGHRPRRPSWPTPQASTSSQRCSLPPRRSRFWCRRRAAR